jgi:hypothetical protein
MEQFSGSFRGLDSTLCVPNGCWEHHQKTQNKTDDFVSSHSCNNMLLVATGFSSELSLEMRHEFITMPHRLNVPAWSGNTLGPWKRGS